MVSFFLSRRSKNVGGIIISEKERKKAKKHIRRMAKRTKKDAAEHNNRGHKDNNVMLSVFGTQNCQVRMVQVTHFCCKNRGLHSKYSYNSLSNGPLLNHVVT